MCAIENPSSSCARTGRQQVAFTGVTAADFNPVRLFDGNDHLVAQEGEALELTGSFAADATTYRPHRCIVGSELWLAGRVGSSD